MANTATTISAFDNPYRVRLSSRTAQAPYGFNRVVFEVSPELSESRTVNYTSLDPVHMPGQIYVYKNTMARTFNISGAKLLSRTPAEADQTLAKLWMLKGWTMPRFGVNSSTLKSQNANQAATGINTIPTSYPTALFTDQSFINKGNVGELLGAPPEVIYLSAYSNQPPPSTSSTTATGPANNNNTSDSAASAASNAVGSNTNFFNGMIANVPVVIQALNIPYPTDVDYIKAASSDVRVPIVMSIDISLLEAHSASEYEQFSLDDFKSGNLPGF